MGLRGPVPLGEVFAWYSRWKLLFLPYWPQHSHKATPPGTGIKIGLCD